MFERPDWSIFDVEVIDKRPGSITLKVSGATALAKFCNEGGGHRWQRTPPTEKNGRVHTSTVTVAVLPEPVGNVATVDERDLEWSMQRGTGAGGQHKNVTDSAVRLRHKPTGLTVVCQSERSQQRNKESALSVLRARLWERQRAADSAQSNQSRRGQIGSGQRGDKRRTIRVRDGVVTDHFLGARWRYSDYVAGKF